MIYTAEGKRPYINQGKRIKEEREKLKFNQEKFLEFLNISSRVQLSRWENGYVLPPYDTLMRMCKIFECEIGYLLCEEGYEESKTRAITDIQKETGLSLEAVNYIKQLSLNEKYFLSNLLTVNYGKNFRMMSEYYKRIQDDIKQIRVIEKGFEPDLFGEKIIEIETEKRMHKYYLSDEVSSFSEIDAKKDIIYFASNK